MSNQSTVKSLLEVKIDEMINSIQRRINLNVQSLKTPKSSQKAKDVMFFETIGGTKSQNGIDKVITDCNQTLNKLFFLKSALNEIGEEDGVYFLDNYHLFSFDDFCNHLYERSNTFQSLKA